MESSSLITNKVSSSWLFWDEPKAQSFVTIMVKLKSISGYNFNNKFEDKNLTLRIFCLYAT